MTERYFYVKRRVRDLLSPQGNRHRFSWYVHKNHHYTIALGTKRPIIEGPKGLGGRIIGLILLRLRTVYYALSIERKYPNSSMNIYIYIFKNHSSQGLRIHLQVQISL
jgi:hypothetical protein